MCLHQLLQPALMLVQVFLQLFSAGQYSITNKRVRCSGLIVNWDLERGNPSNKGPVKEISKGFFGTILPNYKRVLYILLNISHIADKKQDRIKCIVFATTKVNT